MKRPEFKRKNKKGKRRPLPWRAIINNLLLVVGATLGAFGYVLFQLPNNIVAGGLSGIGVIIYHYTGFPAGTFYWIANLPMLILGFYYLGRWKFVFRTLVAATIFAVSIDLFSIYLPQIMTQYPLTDDLLLSSVYAGIIGGISAGLVYRSGSTFGGTAIVGRLIQQRTGLPLSQAYFFTDGIIIAVAGIVFGWEIALYGFLVLFLNGLASDYTLEGPSSTRTATIITNHPEAMAEALIETVHRGVSYWEVTGGYTGQKRYLVTCTVYRPQVNEVKETVAAVDPEAFLTIGISHQALGKGFAPLRK